MNNSKEDADRLAGRRKVLGKRFLRTTISDTRYAVLASLSFLALLLGWNIVSAAKIIPPIFLPSPADVVRALWEALASGELLPDIWASVLRVMVGFLLGAGAAVPIGIVMGSLKSAEALLRPPTEFLRYLPVPAFLPLCILWFGIGDLEKVVVIFLGTFFQLVVLIADDARAVPSQLLEIGYTLGFNRISCAWKIVLPGALPRIFDHIRVGFGWAWSYVVVAEIVAANRGLGFMIMQGQRYLRTADVMAGVLVIGLLGLGADWGLQAAARVLFPYENATE